MVFAGYCGFLHYLQLASHELATIGINVTKNEIQIQILLSGEGLSLTACYLPPLPGYEPCLRHVRKLSVT